VILVSANAHGPRGMCARLSINPFTARPRLTTGIGLLERFLERWPLNLTETAQKQLRRCWDLRLAKWLRRGGVDDVLAPAL